MDGSARFCFDDVDPALGCSADDVVSEGREDCYAGGVFCVLGCLFGCDCWVDLFAVCLSEGGGGEDAFYGCFSGDVDEDGLVFEEGGDEEEAVAC